MQADTGRGKNAINLSKRLYLNLFLQTKSLKDKFKQSFKPIAELDDVLKDSGDEEEEEGFETEDVTVTISTIKPEELAKRNFIGYRKVQESESDESDEEDDDEAVATNSVPGMDTNKSKKAKIIEDKTFLKLTANLKTEKDVKKMVSLIRVLTQWIFQL